MEKQCKNKGCKNSTEGGLLGFCKKCYGKDYRARYKIKYPEKYKKNRKKMSDWWKKFYKENPEHIKKYSSDYYDEHKEECRESSEKDYKKNKEKISKRHLDYANTRYKLDEGFRNRKQLGSALSAVIRAYIKTGKIRNPMRKFNIDWKGIIEVLSPIPKNRSDYQVDHIIPLYKFDLTNIEQIQIAFAPENHRWLLTKENQRRTRKE